MPHINKETLKNIQEYNTIKTVCILMELEKFSDVATRQVKLDLFKIRNEKYEKVISDPMIKDYDFEW